MADSVQPAADRLPFLDGLRGIAAVGVCVAHCASYGIAHAERGLAPPWIRSFLDRGTLGVPMFFVISGFVMRLSLLRRPTDWQDFGRFVLRRSLRLDPPYWASIVFAFGTFALIDRLAGKVYQLPSFGAIFAHATYTQAIVGVPHIQAVYWTLCIEVQFYLLLYMLSAIAGRTNISVTAISTPLLVASLWLFVDPWRSVGPWYLRSDASVIPTFAMFYVGIACCEFCYLKNHLPWFCIGCVAVAVRLIVDWNEYLATATATALLIAAFRSHVIGAVAQLFGRISYSLYLLHAPVAWIAALTLRRVTSPAATWQWVSLVLSFAACAAFATLGYFIIERPSVALSRRAFRATAPTAR